MKKRGVHIALIFALLCSQTSTSAQYDGAVDIRRTMYATIQSPTVGELMSVANPDPLETTQTISPFYKGDNVFTIRGIAERLQPVDLYVFTKVPELITNLSITGTLAQVPGSSWFASIAEAAAYNVELQWDTPEEFICPSPDGCLSASAANVYYGYVRPNEEFNLKTFIGNTMPGGTTVDQWADSFKVEPPPDLADSTNCGAPGTPCNQDCQGGECSYNYSYVTEWLDEEGQAITPTSISETKKSATAVDFYDAFTYTVRVRQVITAEWLDTESETEDVICHTDTVPYFAFIEQAEAALIPDDEGGGINSEDQGEACFLPETLIATPSGQQPIATLHPNDAVISINESTGQTSLSRISRIDVRDVDAFYVLNNYLRVTPSHPFYVLQNGIWATKTTAELSVGDSLITENGEPLTISSKELFHQPATVYNLIDVEPHHNYVAGGVLVHNKGSSSGPGVNPSCSLAGSKVVASASFKVLVTDFDEWDVVFAEYDDTGEPTASINSPGFALVDEVQAAGPCTDNQYIPSRGVSFYANCHVSASEAPGWTPQVRTNPLTTSVNITGLDPTKDYRFALFSRWRETDYTKTPHSNVLSQNSPYDTNADNSTTPVDTAGYLITARNADGGNEVQFGPGGTFIPGPGETRTKVELELVQKNLLTDKDEHFQALLHKMAVNPLSRSHWVAATFQATDAPVSNVGDTNNLSIKTTSRLSFFDLNDLENGQWVLSPSMSYGSSAPNPYGVIYDTWTREPLMNTLLQVEGTTSSLGEFDTKYTYDQRTNTDGMFAFYLPSGKFRFSITDINNVANNFLHPNATLLNNDCNDPQGTTSPYQDPYRDLLYSGQTVDIRDTQSLHKDIPLSPLFCGEINVPGTTIIITSTDPGNTQQYSAIAAPNKKFSFFIPPGSYRIHQVITPDGQTESVGPIPVVVTTAPSKKIISY